MALTGLLRPEIIEIWHKCLNSVLEANFLTNSSVLIPVSNEICFLVMLSSKYYCCFSKILTLWIFAFIFFFGSGFCMKLPLLSTSVIATCNVILKCHWPMKRSALTSFLQPCGSYKACIFLMEQIFKPVQPICRWSSTFCDPTSWRVFDVVYSLCTS